MQELKARDLLLRSFLYASSDKGWIDTDGDSSAYRYRLNGIKEFPTAEELVQELACRGFSDIAFQRLSPGIVAVHTVRTFMGFDLHRTA